MSPPFHPELSPTELLVAEQVGRPLRIPWRIGARCSFGRPTVVVSPSLLDDSSPFPTYAWLTCPHVRERVSAVESSGAIAQFATRANGDPSLAASLRALDARVRELRAAESGGVDACPAVGLGGQRDPLGVKCLHVHVALALLGEDDPIGIEVLESTGGECANDRCAALLGVGVLEEDA